MENKFKKLLIILILSGLFSTLATDFVFAKTKGELMIRFKELSQDVQQEKKIEIQCRKNPDACPVSLESLAIDENGDIEGAEEFVNESANPGFVEKIRQVLSSLGVIIEDGIVKIKELVAEKITATKRIIAPVGQFEKIEMIDKTTGEIYCTWIENSEWVKVKSSCEDLTNDQNSISLTTEPATSTEATSTATTTETLIEPSTTTEPATTEPTTTEPATSTEPTSTTTTTETLIEPSTTTEPATTEPTTTEPATSTEEPATSTIQ